VRHRRLNTSCLVVSTLTSVCVSEVAAQDRSPTFVVELEAGPIWQSRNTVQIPNDQGGTRFSLIDAVGSGPWAAVRLYLNWNVSQRHGIRVLLAPLSLTGKGSLSEAVDFAGQTYELGTPVDATYKFNSWRLGYRYLVSDHQQLKLWIGFTAKIRDAKIELEQAGASSKDTDVGFVPLAHLAGDWRLTGPWHLLFDIDGLAGGPGRAFDGAVKLNYDFDNRWGVSAGYRTLEGGADVESVYAFAWLHYMVIAGTARF
jgi:hypothetical protein